MALKYKATADLKVPKDILSQVIGQDDAVKIINKIRQSNTKYVFYAFDTKEDKKLLWECSDYFDNVIKVK